MPPSPAAAGRERPVALQLRRPPPEGVVAAPVSAALDGRPPRLLLLRPDEVAHEQFVGREGRDYYEASLRQDECRGREEGFAAHPTRANDTLIKEARHPNCKDLARRRNTTTGASTAHPNQAERVHVAFGPAVCSSTAVSGSAQVAARSCFLSCPRKRRSQKNCLP